jgi:hypothetical protein
VFDPEFSEGDIEYVETIQKMKKVM